MVSPSLLLRWLGAITDGRRIIGDALRVKCDRHGDGWSVLGTLIDLAPPSVLQRLRLRWLRRLPDNAREAWYRGADGVWRTLRLPEEIRTWAELDARTMNRLLSTTAANAVERLEEVR